MSKGIKQPPMRNGSPDDFQTPPEALAPLIPYLRPEWTVWECAMGRGNLVRELNSRGFHVIGSDRERDFLACRPPRSFDCIITNPPYSLKDEFLSRCYQLQKPFGLLLPLTALEGKKRQKFFKERGVEILLFNRRINFETPSGQGKGSWFATAWFTWGLNLPGELVFVELAKRSDERCFESC